MVALVVDGLNRQTPYSGPHGTVCHARKKYAVATAFGDGDTVDLIRLPKGAVILDALFQFSAFGASVVGNLGIVPCTTGAKLDIDGICSAIDVSAAGFARREQTAVFSDSALTLDDDDYWVRLALSGANPAAGTVEVIVIYAYDGLK